MRDSPSLTLVASAASIGVELVSVSIWRAVRMALPMLAASIFALSNILSGTDADAIAVDSMNAKDAM